jgi:hypothetical protein
MTTDERLDQLIRGSLEWQASRTAASQPSLERAVERLAARLEPVTTALRPRVVMAPAGRSALSFVALLLLLAALLATALVVGSRFLPLPPPPVAPGPFGFAAECEGEFVPEGVALLLGIEFSGMDLTGNAEDPNITVWRNGSMVVDASTQGETKASTIRQLVIPERRLTQRGVDLLLNRIGEAGLTPGCRSLRTRQAGGRITAVTADGYLHVFWGPNVTSRPLARLLSAEDEAELVALATDLKSPETWLPDDAWVDKTERRVRPDEWLVFVGLRATDHAPGDEVVLWNGGTLAGTDPRYDQVQLPGGAELATFGDDITDLIGSEAGISEARCGTLSTADALALAESLDSLELGTDGEGELFTTDLSLEVTTSISEAFPEENDCQTLAATLRQTNRPLPTAAPPEGDFAAVDPCTFVPPEVAERILQTDGREVHPSKLPLGPPAQACVLFDSQSGEGSSGGYYGGTAMVTLYPRRVARENVQQIALDMLGAETVTVAIAGQHVWVNACYTRSTMPQAGFDCAAAVVAWVEPYLIAFEFTESTGPWDPEKPDQMPPPRVTDEMKREFIEAVLENLED